MSVDGASAAVVIVNYRQEEYLLALFDSISSQTYQGLSVVLVNSGPSNFTPPSGVDVIDMEENRGYGAALNRGIEYALEGGADNVVLLNADTRLDPACIANLVGTDGDIVQPLILLMDRPDRINAVGLKPKFLGVAHCIGYKKSREWAGTEIREIPAASGAAILVRRKVFERIGMFDESYFMYLEDVDFSLRARNAGFRIVMNPQAIVWHRYRLKLGLGKMFKMLKGSGKIRRLL